MWLAVGGGGQEGDDVGVLFPGISLHATAVIALATRNSCVVTASLQCFSLILEGSIVFLDRGSDH